MSGYIKVYTGDGKGKTTAALGLSIRAIGAGLKVFIAQFMKKGNYSEVNTLKKLNDFITIKQYGTGALIKGSPSDEDIKVCEKGLEEIEKFISTKKYDIIIMDEINVAIAYGICSIERLMKLIDCKHEDVELVITGRGAHQELVKRADLVTEAKEVKHYFSKGVKARDGIEK